MMFLFLMQLQAQVMANQPQVEMPKPADEPKIVYPFARKEQDDGTQVYDKRGVSSSV